MKGKNIMGNAGKATLPNGKKMDDFKKPPSFNSNINNNTSSQNGDSKNNGEEENVKSKGTTSTGLPNTQGMGTEAAKVALKQAAGAVPYTSWIPKGIRDKIIDKFMDSGAGQAMVEKSMKQIKTRIILAVIGAVGSVLMSIIFYVVIFSVIMAPVAWVDDALGGIGEFFASLVNWFGGSGWCATEEACQEKAEYKYYEKLNNAVANYKGDCIINEDLITATIFYGQMVDEDQDMSEDGSDKYFNYVDVSEQLGNQSAASQINKLVKVYLKGEEENDSDTYNDNELVEVSGCSSSAANYKEYLIDKYIDKAYPSAITNGRTKEEIADEILKMGNIMLIQRSFASSVYCPSIAVEQSNGSIETMDLEDYVARVVTAENSWYEGNNIENMKAQAIVSRTYALKYTSNCQNPIPNSSAVQSVADTASDLAIQATKETEKLVLFDEGKLIDAQYDDLAINSSDDNYYYLKQNNIAISKSWLDSRVTSEQYENYAVNHHGNGLSIWGSRYLQTIGNNYEQIINKFYTMAEISKMGGLITGGNYYSNISPAVDVNELNERSENYSGNLNIYSKFAGNVSQCPWYAKSRAIEIVYGSNMEDEIKQKAIESLRATNGNGTSWYNNPDGRVFTKTTDYTQPRPGSIVSWSSGGGSQCHTYGHVAIVEQVFDDGTVLLSDSYNKFGADSGNSWSAVAYQTYIVTLDYIRTHKNGIGCTYTFNGYVYLLG